MMRMIQYLVTTMLGLLSMGCVEIIDLDSLRPDPSLVVNCVALIDEPVTVSVSHTWFLTEDRPNVTINDAEVRLFVNGAFVSKMEYADGWGEGYNSRGAFHSGYYPKEGDHIRVEASAPAYGNAWAETVVPRPADLLSVKASSIFTPGLSFYNTRRNTYTVTFRNEASIKDYYYFRLELGYPEYENGQYTGEYDWYNSINYADDPLFGQSVSSLDQILGYDRLTGGRGRVFSDELINGQEYTIQFSEEIKDSQYPFVPDDSPKAPVYRLRVYIHKISKDYYYYLKTLQDQTDISLSNLLVDMGLAEPIHVYNNVEGGVGIVGSCYPTIVEVEVETEK